VTPLQAALADLTPDEDRKLAGAYEVAVSTIEAWRRGVRPHPVLANLVTAAATRIKESRCR
jgi:hypothetical protein